MLFTIHTGSTVWVPTAGSPSAFYAIFSKADEKNHITISLFASSANLNVQNSTWGFPTSFSVLTFLLLFLLHMQMTRTTRKITTRQPAPMVAHIHQLLFHGRDVHSLSGPG